MLRVAIKKQLKSEGRLSLALDLDVTIREGITVLFGPSGAGKTSLLRAIAGILAPDQGKITLGQQTYFDSTAGINLPIQQRKVGVVFQNYLLFPHLTAQQNVVYGMDGETDQAKRARAGQMLALLGIDYTADRYPRQLSGGEQQRVALARALASDPAILLLDEPLSAVDSAARGRLLEEILGVQRRSKIPFIYVTHNHAEAVRIGDYLFVVHGGRIVQAGSPLEVFNTPQSLAVARVVGTENVFVGQVVEHHRAEGVTRVDLQGCEIEASYHDRPPGTSVTIGIRSEDILVSREQVTQTSAKNVLAGVVREIVYTAEGIELMVDCGVDFKVGITVGSVQSMNLQPGQRVYLLIKARACHFLS